MAADAAAAVCPPERPAAFAKPCVLMQGQVKPQELGRESVDKVLKDLQSGKLPAIDGLARRHAAHIGSRGVQESPQVAVNGQLHALEGSPMVCRTLQHARTALQTRCCLLVQAHLDTTVRYAPWTSQSDPVCRQ